MDDRLINVINPVLIELARDGTDSFDLEYAGYHIRIDKLEPKDMSAEAEA